MDDIQAMYWAVAIFLTVSLVQTFQPSTSVLTFTAIIVIPSFLAIADDAIVATIQFLIGTATEAWFLLPLETKANPTIHAARCDELCFMDALVGH
ncbi:MAG: hypothetical protein PHW93_06160 [Candidatus Methanomethylophilaceae archaeon]|nr:hypothetical protein [Candidatus Methanomethylophilaceae archaeon]